MEMWQDPSQNRLQRERNLNFSTLPELADDSSNQKRKLSRDPLSHRIIEKRRRDRMNNCLADLSRLIPTNFVKKSRGRIEKTEIIEMAIKHLKQLMFRVSKHADFADIDDGKSAEKVTKLSDNDQYCLGFQDCMSETMHFLVELDGHCPGEGMFLRHVNHLHDHLENIIKGFHSTNSSNDGHSISSSKICDVDERDVRKSSPQFDRFTPPLSADTYGSNNEADEYVAPPKPHIPRFDDPNDDVYMDDVTAGSEQSQQERRSSEHRDGEERDAGFGNQLREMLLLQNPEVEGSPTSGGRVPSDSNRSGNCGSGSAHSVKGGCGEEVYKFKTNIKERFRADQRTTWTTDGESSRTEDGEELPEVGGGGGDTSASGRTCSESSSSEESRTPSSGRNRTRRDCSVSRTLPEDAAPLPAAILEETKTPQPPPTATTCREIPIFALHPKGSFYIPMILDGEMLEPYVRGAAIASAPTLLHHIGISVHFLEGPIRVPRQLPPPPPSSPGSVGSS